MNKFISLPVRMLVCAGLSLLVPAHTWAITKTRISEINQFISDLERGKINDPKAITKRAEDLKKGLSARELSSFQLELMDEKVATTLAKVGKQEVSPPREVVVEKPTAQAKPVSKDTDQAKLAQLRKQIENLANTEIKDMNKPTVIVNEDFLNDFNLALYDLKRKVTSLNITEAEKEKAIELANSMSKQAHDALNERLKQKQVSTTQEKPVNKAPTQTQTTTTTTTTQQQPNESITQFKDAFNNLESTITSAQEIINRNPNMTADRLNWFSGDISKPIQNTEQLLEKAKPHFTSQEYQQNNANLNTLKTQFEEKVFNSTKSGIAELNKAKATPSPQLLNETKALHTAVQNTQLINATRKQQMSTILTKLQAEMEKKIKPTTTPSAAQQEQDEQAQKVTQWNQEYKHLEQAVNGFIQSLENSTTTFDTTSTAGVNSLLEEIKRVHSIMMSLPKDDNRTKQEDNILKLKEKLEKYVVKNIEETLNHHRITIDQTDEVASLNATNDALSTLAVAVQALEPAFSARNNLLTKIQVLHTKTNEKINTAQKKATEKPPVVSPVKKEPTTKAPTVPARPTTPPATQQGQDEKWDREYGEVKATVNGYQALYGQKTFDNDAVLAANAIFASISDLQKLTVTISDKKRTELMTTLTNQWQKIIFDDVNNAVKSYEKDVTSATNTNDLLLIQKNLNDYLSKNIKALDKAFNAQGTFLNEIQKLNTEIDRRISTLAKQASTTEQQQANWKQFVDSFEKAQKGINSYISTLQSVSFTDTLVKAFNSHYNSVNDLYSQLELFNTDQFKSRYSEYNNKLALLKNTLIDTTSNRIIRKTIPDLENLFKAASTISHLRTLYEETETLMQNINNLQDSSVKAQPVVNLKGLQERINNKIKQGSQTTQGQSAPTTSTFDAARFKDDLANLSRDIGTTFNLVSSPQQIKADNKFSDLKEEYDRLLTTYRNNRQTAGKRTATFSGFARQIACIQLSLELHDKNFGPLSRDVYEKPQSKSPKYSTDEIMNTVVNNNAITIQQTDKAVFADVALSLLAHLVESKQNTEIALHYCNQIENWRSDLTNPVDSKKYLVTNTLYKYGIINKFCKENQTQPTTTTSTFDPSKE